MDYDYDRTKIASGDVADDLRKAVDLLDYMPNAASAWVEAHGGNSGLARANAKKITQAMDLISAVLNSLPKGRRFQVVGFEGGPVVFDSVGELVDAMARKGIKQHGFFSRPGVREEMQGAPVFEELVGPMYGGPGIARYETSEAYDRLSR